MSSNDKDPVDAEILKLDKETQKERQALLAMIMERERYLEKRELDLIEREKSLAARERKLEESKERLLALAKTMRKKDDSGKVPE